MQREATLGKGTVANELRIWGISCQEPPPLRTTLSVSGEINQLEGTGWLPQNSNGGPLWGLGVFHWQTGFESQQSIKMGQWRHRGGTQRLSVSCGWLSGAKCYAHSWIVPREWQPCLPLPVKALQREWDMISVSHHTGEICQNLAESSQNWASPQNIASPCPWAAHLFPLLGIHPALLWKSSLIHSCLHSGSQVSKNVFLRATHRIIGQAHQI